ncbi:MAG TPA: hypothetical protein VF481_01345 [Novosphingobium sp.]
MYELLSDITDRIPDPPRWWSRGIPRYCDFHPRHTLPSGTGLMLLLHVECQACEMKFDVAIFTHEQMGQNLKAVEKGTTIDAAYDDPPHHLNASGYNCSGNAMLMVPLRVHEAWQMTLVGQPWTRCRVLEGPVDPFA